MEHDCFKDDTYHSAAEKKLGISIAPPVADMLFVKKNHEKRFVTKTVEGLSKNEFRQKYIEAVQRRGKLDTLKV